MLSKNTYTQEYIDYCRKRINAQVSAFTKITNAAGNVDEPNLAKAVNNFESPFFNDMVLLLDAYFCHRSRTLELKDGNPLNEVRVLCNSILENGGVMLADKQIKLKPETSVLKYEVGDRIALDKSDFKRLTKAFFAELENKFLT